MKSYRHWLILALIVCPIWAVAAGMRKSVTGGIVYAGQDAPRMSATRDSAGAEAIPQKQEVLAIVRNVNSYQLAHPVIGEWEATHPGVSPMHWPWPRATYYTGVMGVWKATHDRSFLEQAAKWGRESQWGVGEEQLGANRLFPMQTWLEVYFVKKDHAMIEPSIKWLATPDPLTPAGAKRWYLDARGEPPPVTYADSLYGAAALAMIAKATGDKKYLDIMNAFFDDVTGELFDKEAGLYYRDRTFIGQRTPNGKKIFWSRGNGWVFAGIARILEYLPQNDPSRQHYLGIFRRQAAELIKRQGADGLWRMNLDDPKQYPDPETSGTGFFCFGLAWGINQGVLERDQYLPAVEKSWHGLTQSLSPEGKVLWGQLVGDRPETTTRNDTHEYVTGAFLLAGSEVYKLAR
jgi:unsaturated rhamnogalacturonyl hydrolase